MTRSSTRKRLIVGAVLAVLVAAMVLNTRFLTAESLANIGPKAFSPQETAQELFGRAQTELPAQAAPLADVLPAAQSDITAAAGTFAAVSPSENSYDFPVTATGTVNAESTAESLRLDVDGLTSDTPVLVPITTAVNGTVIRDAMGFKFADAPGQTDFQYVGDELKKLVQSNVVAGLGDPTALIGKRVTVVGVLGITVTGSTNQVPEAKPANIQPVSIQVTA